MRNGLKKMSEEIRICYKEDGDVISQRVSRPLETLLARQQNLYPIHSNRQHQHLHPPKTILLEQTGVAEFSAM
uniref:Ovule protein n=1 Tax=Caenorhabditis tropicalis TaxID=1561998 RepID=A0A1I7TRA1_9PELO